MEELLRCRLFVRNKGGTTLTAQGRWFQSHAATLVRTVERVRQEIGVAHGFTASVTIGGRFGLWEGLLLPALPRLRETLPELSIKSEIGFEDDLMQGLVEGRLDIGVMYTPHHRPGLTVELLYEETLLYVCTDPDATDLPGQGYVYVDWGPEFDSQHSATFPEFGGPGLSANVGWLGLQHILAYGGSGYFQLRLVKDELRTGSLHRRREAPDFSLPAYIVYATDAAPETAAVVDLIRSTTQAIVAETS